MNMKIKERLKNLKRNQGFSYIFICVLMLGLFMTSMAVWEFIRLSTIVSNVHLKLESALTVVATRKYGDVYASVRDGYATPYKKYSESGTWSNLGYLNGGQVTSEAMKELNAGEKIQVNSIKSVGNITCQYMKASSASNYNDISNPDFYRYKASGTFEVEIPFKMLWSDSFTVTLDADAQWTSQFGTAYN